MVKINTIDKDNRGFSLIEIVITVAIMILVGGSIVGFLMAGSNSYNSVSADSDLQKESQLAMNQVSEMIIDASKALFVKDETDNKFLYVYNDDFRYVIRYAKAEKKLYYTREERDSLNHNFLAGSESLMAEALSKFELKLDNVESKRKVSVEITVERKDRSYNTNDLISLRNQIKVSNTYGEIY